MKNSKSGVSKAEFLTRVGILTAVGTVMYLFLPEIPIMVGHLKFDISDLPAMIAGLTTGPAAGAAVIIIKNIFHLLKSTTMGIGEVVNILVGCTMIFTLCGVYNLTKRLRKSEKIYDHFSYFIACIVTIAVTVGTGFLYNLALTPVFLMAIGSEVTASAVVGFAASSAALNLVKSIANTVLVYPVFIALRPFVVQKGKKLTKT